MASDTEKPLWLKKIEIDAQKRAERLVKSGIRTEDLETVYEELRESLLELHYDDHPEDRDQTVVFDEEPEPDTVVQDTPPVIQTTRSSDTIKSGPTIIPPASPVPPASPIPSPPVIPPSRSTPIQVADRRGIIVVQTHTPQRLQTPETDKAFERTREYRSMVRDAGMFTLSQQEQAELAALHPKVSWEGTDTSTALNLSVLGIDTNELGRKVQSSNVLTRAEANRLANINEILKIIYAADRELANDLREVNLYPQIVIERRDPIAAPLPDASGALALNPVGNNLQPLLNVATGEAKKRASSAITNKITGKLAKEGVKAGVKTATKAAASTTAAEVGATVGTFVGGPIGTLIVGAIGWLVGTVLGGAIEYLGKRANDLKDLAGGLIVGGGQAIGWIVGILWAATVGIGQAVIIAIISIPVLLAFIIFIINTSAWVVPPWDGTGTFGGTDPSEEIDSAFIDVTKVANPSEAENSELPLTVTYTVTVTAEQSTLTNISFTNTCEVFRDGVSPTCTAPIPDASSSPASISPLSPYVYTYEVTYDGANFTDSLVIDSFGVTADAEGLTGEQSVSSATVRIGDPPDDCPSIWPVSTSAGQEYYINQGPGGAASHLAPNGWQEAIDVHPEGNILSRPDHFVIATHSGTAYPYQQSDAGLGVRVDGECAGLPVTTWYAHLTSQSVSNGQQVTKGQVLGIMGQTGAAQSGPHVHYEFADGNQSKDRSGPPPFLIAPFVPITVPVGCVGRAACGIDI